MSKPSLKKDSARNYQRDEVIRIINSALQKARSNPEPARDTLIVELQKLKEILEDSRKEIGRVRPSDISDKHIPTATDELDAVVEATEEASGVIMDACEAIQGCLDKVPDPQAKIIEEQVIKIFEACSFQDITGQRIAKVLNNIGEIEAKVNRILAVVGENPETDASTQACPSEEKDESLLNGPQRPDQAISQHDIDKILAEFDKP